MSKDLGSVSFITRSKDCNRLYTYLKCVVFEWKTCLLSNVFKSEYYKKINKIVFMFVKDIQIVPVVIPHECSPIIVSTVEGH